MTATPTLLSPLRIGPVQVRNRIVSTAHGAFLDFYRPGEPPDRYVTYQERRAAGGCGLIILQPVHVHPSSQALGHHVYEADDLHAKLSLLARRIQAHGTRVLLQLLHFGAEFVSDARRDLEPLWGFSETVSPTGGETAHAMTDGEIEAVIDGFARTAQIAAAAGLDGVEIHAAHGYLVQQSFSPWANRRDDRWGDHRRFVLEVLRRVREAVGESRVVSIRMSLDDHVPKEAGGLGPPGLREVAQDVVSTGLVDLLNTSTGSRASHYATAVANYHHAPGHLLPLVRAMRAAAGAAVPVVGVGRITSGELAEHALTSGDCDLVAMTRAQIADPDLVAKLSGDDPTPVRPCVGANQGCVDRMIQALPITCFHNPDVGRESRVPSATSRPRRVLVVGGGPGGMKAAETAARRGHEVTLVEAHEQLGGRLLAASSHGPARELRGALDWLYGQLERHQVRVELGTRVSVADVLAHDADQVILATGATPDPAQLVADDTVARLSTDQVMTQPVAGRHILVVDHLGTHEVARAAERAAASGADVRIVTPAPTFGSHIGFTHLRGQIRRLVAHGARIDVSTRVVSIAQGVATLQHVHSKDQVVLPVDAIVVGLSARADTMLHAELLGRDVHARLVGDAVAPRNAMLAIREGADAGAAI